MASYRSVKKEKKGKKQKKRKKIEEKEKKEKYQNKLQEKQKQIVRIAFNTKYNSYYTCLVLYPRFLIFSPMLLRLFLLTSVRQPLKKT